MVVNLAVREPGVIKPLLDHCNISPLSKCTAALYSKYSSNSNSAKYILIVVTTGSAANHKTLAMSEWCGLGIFTLAISQAPPLANCDLNFNAQERECYRWIGN